MSPWEHKLQWYLSGIFAFASCTARDPSVSIGFHFFLKETFPLLFTPAAQSPALRSIWPWWWFVLQVSRPHPSDHPLLILFVVGGITVSEAKMIKDLVPSLKPGTQVPRSAQWYAWESKGKSRKASEGPSRGFLELSSPSQLLLSHLLLPMPFSFCLCWASHPPGGGGQSGELSF